MDDVTTADPTLPLSPYREIGRAEWARLAAGLDQPLTETEVVELRGSAIVSTSPRSVRSTSR